MKSGVRAPGLAPKLLVLGVAAATCFAVQAELASEKGFFETIPAVYSATRLDQDRLETPVSVSVITREMIEASTAIEIPDLLRLVPGFQVAHANGAVFAPTYHGSADQIPRSMEVMIDGRSVYQPTVSAVEWSTLGLAIDDIERIEVVRGPNAASFGNNAIRGSINIVTRQPFFLRGPYARLTIGSIDTGNGVARYGGRLGQADASITLQYRDDAGFDGVDDHKQIGDVRVRASYQANVRDFLDVQAGYSDGETGAWGEPGDPLNPPRDRSVQASYVNLAWQRMLAEDNRFRASLSLNQFSHSDLFQAPAALNPGETFTFGSYDADTLRYDLEFEHQVKLAEGLRLAWGAGSRYDRLSTDIALGNQSPATELSWRLFGNAEWRPVPTLIVNAGAQASFREVGDDHVSPRLGVNWLFAPNQMVRFSASRAYYVGTLYQQYANYYLIDSSDETCNLGVNCVPYVISTGPGLEAEHMTSYELGYIHRWPAYGIQLDLKAFREEFRNEGFSERVESNPFELPIVWGDSAGEWTTEGAEVELSYRQPARGTALNLAYAWATVEGIQADAADAQFNPIDFERYDDTVPRHTFSLQLSQRLAPDWSGTLAVFYVDDVKWRGLGDDVEAYTRLDLKLSRNWRVSGHRVGVDLVVQNLLDDAYIEFEDANRFDRRAYLQFRFE